MGNRNLMANIAQIAILVLILPIVFLVIDADMLMNFVQGIPIFDTWTGVLYNVATLDTSSLIWVYIKSFLEAIIMGICVHVANGIAKALQARGLPILSTFVGILVGSLLIKVLGITQGFQIIIYVAILIVGILMMVKGFFTSLKVMSLKSFLVLLIESILAVIMCGYVVALLLFSEGAIGVSKVIFVLIISVVALIITYFVTRVSE